MSAPGLVVIGAGGQGREAAAIALDLLDGPTAPPFRTVLGVVDDDPGTTAARRVHALGLDVLGGRDVLADLPPGTTYVVGIASGDVRRRLAALADDLGLRPAVLVHPGATLGRGTTLGPGTVVWPGARISTGVRLGDHVHVNQGCTIGHDAVCEPFATLNPSCAVSGDVTVATGALVGAAAVVLQGLRVGSGATVGAGACVVRDVASGVVVKGVPAR